MPATSDMAIDLSHVSKVYSAGLFKRGVTALRGIQMQVARGEIFGLLGPNGAGKSTLVKILMTVIRPTRCEGTVLGQPVGSTAALRQIGYLPEHHRFPDYLTGKQVIDFYGGLQGVPRRERRLRSDRLLELVGMRDWGDTRVRGYSKGMRQRIGIAQALINEPQIVLLDEPTDGVDPVGRRDIRAVCQRLKDEGKSVFINSHLLSELELVCDRVAIIVQGVVASQGTLDELTKQQQRYEIELADASASSAALLEAVAAEAKPEGPQIQTGPGMLRVATTEAGRVQWIIDSVRARGGVIKSVRAVRPSLEDLFMRAVTDPNSGEVLAPGADLNIGGKKKAVKP